MENEQNIDKGFEPEFVEWARQWMRQANAAAEAVTVELGLPPEKKFDVLRIMFPEPQVGQVGTPKQGPAEPASGQNAGK